MSTTTNGIVNTQTKYQIGGSDVLTATALGSGITNSPVNLAVTGIDAVKTYATADGTYSNGWKWLFHITIPDAENGLNMKFDNWSNGTSAILSVNNMRFYSAQSSNGSNPDNAVLISQSGVYGSNTLNITSDLDATKTGKQVDVIVEMSVPVGSTGGSYSTSYGIKTQ
ncbi:MAG: hypothetical protein WCQ00_01980 [bacterium]